MPFRSRAWRQYHLAMPPELMYECDSYSECGVTIPPTPHPSICPFIYPPVQLQPRFNWLTGKRVLRWTHSCCGISMKIWILLPSTSFPPTHENNQLVLLVTHIPIPVTKQWIDFLRDDPCCAIYPHVYVVGGISATTVKGRTQLWQWTVVEGCLMASDWWPGKGSNSCGTTTNHYVSYWLVHVPFSLFPSRRGRKSWKTISIC